MNKNKYPGIVQCLGCGIVLVSNTAHDFQKCKCPNYTFVDGGKFYTRYGGEDVKLVQPMRMYKRGKR